MMPVITISFIFSKQRRLVIRAVPLQNELAGPTEPFDDAANRLGIQIGTTNLPRRARSSLFTLQQPRFYQSRYRMVTDATKPGGFAQADSLRVRYRTFLTWNRMVAPCCGDPDLVPPLRLSG